MEIIILFFVVAALLVVSNESANKKKGKIINSLNEIKKFLQFIESNKERLPDDIKERLDALEVNIKNQGI